MIINVKITGQVWLLFIFTFPNESQKINLLVDYTKTAMRLNKLIIELIHGYWPDF